MVRVRRLAGRATGERGFTLIELMIAVALLGVGMAFITNMFLNGWRLWKRSYDELNIQRNTRDAVALITRSLREASAATVSISTPAGAQQFGQISFRTGQGVGWIFRQSGTSIIYVTQMQAGPATGTTILLTSDVDSLTFVYPNLQDTHLIDVGLTARKIPYSKGNPIIVQIVERVLMRNP